MAYSAVLYHCFASQPFEFCQISSFSVEPSVLPHEAEGPCLRQERIMASTMHVEQDAMRRPLHGNSRYQSLPFLPRHRCNATWALQMNICYTFLNSSDRSSSTAKGEDK